MNCLDVQSRIISNLLNDRGVANQPEITEHIGKCHVCRREVSELEIVISQYLKESLGQIPIPQSCSSVFAAQVHQKIQLRRKKDKRYFIYKIVATAAILLVSLVSYFLYTTSYSDILEGTLCIERDGKETIIKGLLPIGQAVKTSMGQSAKVKLRDGSVVKMMSSTVLILKEDRLLNLEEGELNCQVAKGGGFVISMAGAELKTLGTEFNVRLSINRKEITTLQNKPLSFIASATVKVVVASGRIALTTEQDHRRLYQEVGTGETVIREIDPSLPVELQTEIKDLIRQLGNDNKAIQEKAFEALLKIGFSIVPFLEEVLVNRLSGLNGLSAESVKSVYKLLARFPRSELLWSHEIPQASFALPPPVISSDQVYIVSESGLYAMDYLTGKVNWEFKQEGFNLAPLVAGGVVYIGTLGGEFFAIDSEKGKIIWQQTGLGNIQSTPVLQGNSVYIVSSAHGTRRGGLYALDIRTGGIQWHFFTGSMIIYSAPAIFSQELVVFGDWDGKLYALKAKNGEMVWAYQANGKIVTSAIGTDDLIYFGSGDGKFCALDIQTAQKRWSFQSDSDIIESPVWRGRTIYWGTRHKIYAFDPEKRAVVWTYNRERSNIGTIVVQEGRVYLGTDGDKAIALDATTGEQVWEYNITDNNNLTTCFYNVVSSPNIFNDVLYITSRCVGSNNVRKDRIYALKLKR